MSYSTSKNWLSLIALIGWLLSSCAEWPLPSLIKNGDQKPSPNLSLQENIYPLSRFSDVPVPSKFNFDPTKSFIYESGSSSVKVGRLFFSGWASQKKVITFFENEMINNGWTIVRVIQHDSTMLIYEKENRVCTIIISSTLGQSMIEIQVGPK